MKGLHVINSWGNKKTKNVRMICKSCGSYFTPLWDYEYIVAEYADVDYVDIDKTYG